VRGSMKWSEKWNERVAATDSLLCVGLDPDPLRLPDWALLADDPVLEFNRRLIELTAPYASAFKLNSSCYEALGTAGWGTLQQSIALVPPEIPVILDAKRADVGPSAEAYARAAFDVLDVDAITVSPYLGEDALTPFFRRAERGVFVLCHTSNPGAGAVQELSCGGRALYERVAELALSWNARGNVGLVVGATYPSAVQRLRSLVPDMVFLVPGLGAQGGDLRGAIAAGLDSQGQGMLLSVSRGVIFDPQPDQAAARWRDAINAARTSRTTSTLVDRALEDDLVLALHAAGCVQFGEFRLHSGELSPIYIDLRLLVSVPALLQSVARAMAALLRDLQYDRLAAIPYAALPIGTAVALEMNQPLIYPRREVKAYGTQRAIEGQFLPGERVVVLDDVVTTGRSKLGAIAPLQAAGLRVEDIVVLVDREQGGAQQLAAQGYRVHSVLRLGQIVDVLARSGRISAQQCAQARAWLEDKR